MAREFKETAHLKTNLNAYSEGWERIFQKVAQDKLHEAVLNAEKESLCDCWEEDCVCEANE
jgi:hypothetical protein